MRRPWPIFLNINKILLFVLCTPLEKLHLGDHTVETLRYLKSFPRLQDEADDAKRFFDWKAALGMIQIFYNF